MNLGLDPAHDGAERSATGANGALQQRARRAARHNEHGQREDGSDRTPPWLFPAAGFA